jgi:hypothetical protein
MAIITDPDLLARSDVIFGTSNQKISIYPVGDTERNGAGVEYVDCWVASSGTISSGQDFSVDSVVAGDVVAILNEVDSGHYYVNNVSTVTLTLAEIDSGTAGAATTGLTTATSAAWDGTTDLDDTTERITLSGHGYVTGDALIYDDGGGTTVTGLSDKQVVYVIRVDANTIELATTYANAIAGTNINLTDTGTSTANVFHKRLIVQVFNNGASTSEQIGGNDTSGDGDGDVADGITLQAIYSFGKEEWRVDSAATDIDSNSWNDDLIRHEFPFEAITSEQFEVGGGTSHDNWNWLNSYTRKKVRTAGWAEKTRTGTGDLGRETGIITLGSLDADAQVYYQQTSVVTPKADFTFLGPVNEALTVYADASADNTPESDFTTFLKLFVRKKGRTYAGSEISDIGVTTIQTIVNRFPLSHTTDAAITISDGQLLATNPYKFPSAPVAIDTGTDGSKTINQLTFTSAGSTFTTTGVIPGDILQITDTGSTEQGYYEITNVTATVLTVKEVETVAGNDFTFGTGWAATESTLDFSIFSSVLVPAPGTATLRDSGTLTDETATGLVDATGVTGTLTDSGASFVTDGVAVDDILVLTNAYDMTFNASTDVDNTTADTITFANHNLRTGDRVIYDINGGTTITELTDGRVYYASVESANRFYVCATLDDAWSRAYGDSTEITLTPGASENHIFKAVELNGCYPITARTATTLTVDTTDNQFPSTSKTVGTTYRIVEAGMYLEYRDKTVDQFNDTQTTTPLTDLDFSGLNTITIAGPDFDFDDDAGANVPISEGDMIEIAGSTSNDGRYTVQSRTSATVIVVKESLVANDTNDHTGVTISVKQGFKRTIGSGTFSFNWRLLGNGGTLQNCFEFVQKELRGDVTVDCGPGTFVPSGNSGLVGFIGNINDLLMSFSTPTGTGLNMIIDNLASNDINNATFNDHAGTARNFPFTASGSLVFNPNLTNDQNSKYWLFFANDDAGDNLGRDYGTENAIVVNDATSPTPNAIQGFVNASGGATHGGTRTVDSGTTSITFTYDYDNNIQRGSASSGTDAPVTLVAIGAPVGQFVIASGNITATTGITISAVAALERNYSGSLTAS